MSSHYEPELNKHFNYIFKSSVFNTIAKNCPCGERKDILVVDDNIFNIVTLQAILELQFGITSDKASNGLEALNKVKERDAINKASPCVCGKQKD